jgi:hypothetical protein
MPVYSTRFKSSRSSGVVVAHHEAATLARAEASARAWCNAEPGRMYISTQAWITFTDANLPALAPSLEGQQPAAAIEQDEAALPVERRGPGRPRKEAVA